MNDTPVAELDQAVDDEELDAIVEKTLNEAGIELEELRAQAYAGQFDSEHLRRAWFVIRGLGRG